MRCSDEVETNIKDKVILKLPQVRSHELQASCNPPQQVSSYFNFVPLILSLRIPITNSLPWWNSFLEAGPATQKQVFTKYFCSLPFEF